ncbi:MAG: aminotransferase class V-fold PLP-dependent enzyme [Actinobacteria bacterium]|nr:MAG: aminotransferase class V-fold PLP-dependent enzyme [Actinomycetota bacterium]
MRIENPLWGPEWPSVRARWPLDPERVHLNHGSFGAVPTAVLDHQEDLRRRVERNPVSELWLTFTGGREEARHAAAAFLGADPDGFAFVPNATTGVNAVLSSLALGAHDEVLITDHAYGAVRYAVERACAKAGATVVVQPVPLPPSAEELSDAVLAGVTAHTRLAVVDQIASPTGLRFPVERLVVELRSRGVLSLVDGAHAPGMIDVDLTAVDPDFWTGNFHKWCCAPLGSAGLWVRGEHRPWVAPPVTSWFVGEPYPASFRWIGTDDYSAYEAVPAALAFMADLGWDRVRTHNRALAAYGRDVVARALGTEPPIPPGVDGLVEAMTLVALPPGVAETEDAAVALRLRIADELGIEALPLAWNGSGYLRLSAQAYNAPANYERLAEGLPGLLARTSPSS